jgi:hypothetical protein
VRRFSGYFNIPLPKTRELLFMKKTKLGSLLNLRNLGGQPLNGRVFQLTEGTAGNYTVYTDKINSG